MCARISTAACLRRRSQRWRPTGRITRACRRPVLARPADAAYCDFDLAIASRRDIPALVRGHGGVVATHAAFMGRLEDWWRRNLPAVAQLAPAQGQSGNVYALRRALVADISDAFADQTLLNAFQIRGAMARYVDELKADLKSVAGERLGRGADPCRRIAAKPVSRVGRGTRQQAGAAAGIAGFVRRGRRRGFRGRRGQRRDAGQRGQAAERGGQDARRPIEGDVERGQGGGGRSRGGALSRHVHSSVLKLGGTLSEPDFDAAKRIVDVAEKARADELFVAPLRKLAQDGPAAAGLMATIATRLERHKALEDEAKALKADLRAAEKKQEELVAQARAKITPDEARYVLLERFHRKLVETYRAYLDADRRAITAAVENLHDKYAVTVREIETARDKAAAELGGYLKALGYV
jgi:type I restriction enzyme M protein